MKRREWKSGEREREREFMILASPWADESEDVQVIAISIAKTYHVSYSLRKIHFKSNHFTKQFCFLHAYEFPICKEQDSLTSSLILIASGSFPFPALL